MPIIRFIAVLVLGVVLMIVFEWVMDRSEDILDSLNTDGKE